MNLHQVFPLNRRVMREDSRSLIAVVKIADWLLGWVPLVGAILGVAFWIIGVYCAVGIIVAVLEYFRTEN